MNTRHSSSRSIGQIALLVLATVELLAGCASSVTSVPAAGVPGELPMVLSRYADAGEYEVSVHQGTLKSEYGCTVRYEVYEPSPLANSASPGGQAATVILGHGFMRDLTRMRGWAEHWASYGVRTAVVSYCNSSWVAGRHDRNAADMIAVADLLVGPAGPEDAVIYAGFSAGGLSALVAANSDPRAVAYLGLDAVDSGELAAPAREFSAPALFIIGEPSSCNAQNNMVVVLPPTAHAVRVPYATHCDFENPYDPGCERICGAVTPPESADAIRETILVVATAWIVDQSLSHGTGMVGAGTAVLDELQRARRVIVIQ